MNGDVAAAKRFFSKTTKKHGTLRVITLDAYAASHRAIKELKSVGTIARRVGIRSSKYLNNVVEQDHRRIKQRIRPMLGFKRLDTATITYLLGTFGLLFLLHNPAKILLNHPLLILRKFAPEP